MGKKKSNFGQGLALTSLARLYALRTMRNWFIQPQWITVSRMLEEMTAEVNFTYAGKHHLCSGEEMYGSGNGSLIMHYRLNRFNENMFTGSGLTYQEFIQKYNQRVFVTTKIRKMIVWLLQASGPHCTSMQCTGTKQQSVQKGYSPF